MMASTSATELDAHRRHDAAATRRVAIDTAEPAWIAPLLHLDVVAVVLVLFVSMSVRGQPLNSTYALLALVGAIGYGRCVTPPAIRAAISRGIRIRLLTTRLFVEWLTVVALVLLTAFSLKSSDALSRAVLLTWFAATPLALVATYRLQLAVAAWGATRGALESRFVIVGANPAGTELLSRMSAGSFLGFFDFRSRDRVSAECPGVALVGGIDDVATFVKRKRVATVYVALPLAKSPRIVALLESLRDTTANVYFIPDVFSFDLIQGRVVDLEGIPAFAVCDTPIRGGPGVTKRAMDAIVSAIALIVLSPLMLLIAAAVKLTSPGPALFVQRRYGLDGREIPVLKFRSMTVCKEEPHMLQFDTGAMRVTALGRLLRRSSLDELPQLVNVLRGEMSLVGPRPHAIEHNELYRRQISGYMLRHKVRPGMTGWAQVHGLRGATDTIEKMESRVRYDLEYLSNWSLLLDVRILARTVLIVVSGENAY